MSREKTECSLLKVEWLTTQNGENEINLQDGLVDFPEDIFGGLVIEAYWFEIGDCFHSLESRATSYRQS